MIGVAFSFNLCYFQMDSTFLDLFLLVISGRI